ncbi:MAG: CbiQ family ECF transporter T component [Pseudomonadota bacterium]
MPHPAALILLWVGLTVAMQSLQVSALLLTGAALLAAAWALDSARLFALLRRTRWIMLSLLLIYGYATPGTGIWMAIGIYSPTWQGLGDGLLQLGRLANTLAGLCILLSLLPQQKLLGGLYTLTYPLRYFGDGRERLAVRLALTLRYAETTLLDTSADWRADIHNRLAPAEFNVASIEIHTTIFRMRDGWAVLAGFLLALIV